MSSKAIDSATAEEHLRDGQDCIQECVKTLQRVQKNFPHVSAELAQYIEALGTVRNGIGSVVPRLQRE